MSPNENGEGTGEPKEYKVKGITILGLIKLLKKKVTPEEMHTVMQSLEQQDRDVLNERILVSSWYPYRVFHNLLKSIDDVVGGGDGSLAYEIGRLSAERDLTTVYRSVLSFLSTGFVTRRALAAWKNYYSAGELELTKDEKSGPDGKYRSMKFRMNGFKTLSSVHCMNILGWCEKFIELLGAEEISVKETSCVHKGDSFCEFELSWRDKD